MNYGVFTELDWVYPDTELDGAARTIDVAAPRDAFVCAQVLTDLEAVAGAPLSARVDWEGGSDLAPPEVFQLVDVMVEENTGAKLFTTLDPAESAGHAVRQAPYRVYEALKPLWDGPTRPGRLALCVRIRVDALTVPGAHAGTLRLRLGEARLDVPVRVEVHRARVPRLAAAAFGMVNWLHYGNIAKDHGLDPGSEAYWEMVERYFRLLVHMRNTHIMICPGEPVRDASGTVTGFDFARAERMTRVAFDAGLHWVIGDSVAKWPVWDAPEYQLKWDRETGVRTAEGYRQLALYFEGWRRVIDDNGWGGRMCQSLADEPQAQNEVEFRILAGICRKHLPGVPILEAVETPGIGGAVDVWVPKQAAYERDLVAFRAHQDAGQPFWYYTCSFPTGPILDRVLDAPLTATRLLPWMAFGYGMTGFLHWGGNYHNEGDVFESTCIEHGKGRRLPPGEDRILYPGVSGPWSCLRLEVQRGGTEDFELLTQLAACDEARARQLQTSACRSFTDFEKDGTRLEQVRRELLKAVSAADSAIHEDPDP